VNLVSRHERELSLTRDFEIPPSGLCLSGDLERRPGRADSQARRGKAFWLAVYWIRVYDFSQPHEQNRRTYRSFHEDRQSLHVTPRRQQGARDWHWLWPSIGEPGTRTGG